MKRKLLGTVLLLLTTGCCCNTCSNCTDHLSPVLDGPYPPNGARAGSAFGGAIYPIATEGEESIVPEASPIPVSEDS